jgi:predicted transcriptional regulator
MALTVRLDPETQHCLDELLKGSDQDKSSLVRELIRERWQQHIDRELAEGETLVSEADLSY